MKLGVTISCLAPLLLLGSLAEAQVNSTTTSTRSIPFAAIRHCDASGQYDAFYTDFQGVLSDGKWELDKAFTNKRNEFQKEHYSLNLNGKTLSYRVTGSTSGNPWKADDFRVDLVPGRMEAVLTNGMGDRGRKCSFTVTFSSPPIPQQAITSKTEKPQPTVVQQPANNVSCASTVGVEKAREFVNQCKQISPSTNPPCNAQNSCQTITEEINRGCDLARSFGGKAPTFCQASSVPQSASTPQSPKVISANPQIRAFVTPSKNISCIFSDRVENSDGGNVECEISQFTPSFDKAYALRTDPDNQSCVPSYLKRYEVSKNSRTGLNSCPILDFYDPINGPVLEFLTLPYGSAFQKYGLSCLSEQKGVTCQNAAGHGFFLSKAQQRLF